MRLKTEARLLHYVCIIPTLFFIIFVFAFPIGKSIYLSLHGIRFMEKNAPFVGLNNYIQMFNDYYFWHSFVITGLYTLIYTVGVFGVGILCALLLNKNFSGRSAIRTFMTLPYAIPDAVASMVWLWMLDYQFGIINYVLRAIGLINKPLDWFGSSVLALPAVVGITIWRLFPMHVLIIFAGLQSVPQSLYESAEIDGAGKAQKFFYITIPQLRQILEILLMLTIIWCFRRFTIIWLLTRGGPQGSTETFVIQIYRYAFIFNKMGYAATIGNFVLFLLIALTIIYLKCTKTRS